MIGTLDMACISCSILISLLFFFLFFFFVFSLFFPYIFSWFSLFFLFLNIFLYPHWCADERNGLSGSALTFQRTDFSSREEQVVLRGAISHREIQYLGVVCIQNYRHGGRLSCFVSTCVS